MLGRPALPVLLPVGGRWAGRWRALLFGDARGVQLGMEKVPPVTAPGADRLQVEVALGEGPAPQWAVQGVRGALGGAGQAVAIPREIVRGCGPVAGRPLRLGALKAGVKGAEHWEARLIAGELAGERRGHPSPPVTPRSSSHPPLPQFPQLDSPTPTGGKSPGSPGASALGTAPCRCPHPPRDG